MRRTLGSLGCAAAAATLTAALAVTAPTPAHADGGTTIDVQLAAAGGLTISQPSQVATLSGTAAAGETLTGSLGQTTVTDQRGTLLGWSVTAATSGDLVSTTDPEQTISLGTSAAGGPLTVNVASIDALGSALLAGVVPGAGGSLNPSSPVTLATALPALGAGSFTFNPGLTFRVPANTFAGTYQTVVTQTVA